MSYIEDMFSLKSKVAIVTGASRGNGKAIAQGLSDAGATVMICDILSMDSLNDMVKCKADLTSDEGFGAFQSAVEDMFHKFNRIDILVNNAGLTRGGDALSYSMEDWGKTIQLNLETPFRISQLVAKYMKKAKVDQSSTLLV
jgi:NAD(P)-dependent dehydrogenase (short-subunit alcohol dehydrogenase family)